MSAANAAMVALAAVREVRDGSAPKDTWFGLGHGYVAAAVVVVGLVLLSFSVGSSAIMPKLITLKRIVTLSGFARDVYPRCSAWAVAICSIQPPRAVYVLLRQEEGG